MSWEVSFVAAENSEVAPGDTGPPPMVSTTPSTPAHVTILESTHSRYYGDALFTQRASSQQL